MFFYIDSNLQTLKSNDITVCSRRQTVIPHFGLQTASAGLFGIDVLIYVSRMGHKSRLQTNYVCRNRNGLTVIDNKPFPG